MRLTKEQVIRSIIILWLLIVFVNYYNNFIRNLFEYNAQADLNKLFDFVDRIFGRR